MTSNFIKGLKLSEQFYHEAVEPILRTEWPQMPYSAGLLLHGSDALGFDTPQSMDHDWGPRLQLFLDDADLDAYRNAIDEILRQKLPREFHGFSTHFGRLKTLDAQTWQDREHHLSRVCEFIAERHNHLGLTQPLPTQVSAFHDRPFQVIQAGIFADALRAAITDARVFALPAVGAIDQCVDSTAVLSSPNMFNRVKGMYVQSG